MARSDLLLNLVRASRGRDDELFTRTLEALVADERSKRHDILADRLAQFLNRSPNGSSRGVDSGMDDRTAHLLSEIRPRISLDDLVLSDSVRESCSEIVEEHHRADVLRSHGLEPRSKVLLIGPPGNGKTSLAEALASALLVPLFAVRYDGVIGSYLGETASRLRHALEFVQGRPCVLFFDEFETMGKERGDVNETGEIKRVVSSLLLQVDALPSHVLVVTATNHPELLDRAVWRRFQVRLVLELPTKSQVEAWLQMFEARVGASLGTQRATLARRLLGLSFAELNEFTNDVVRRYVLSSPKSSLSKIVDAAASRWERRVGPRTPKR